MFTSSTSAVKNEDLGNVTIKDKSGGVGGVVLAGGVALARGVGLARGVVLAGWEIIDNNYDGMLVLLFM